MKILTVGGGGREHAIIAALSRSPKVDKLYAAPGNGGISTLAECFPVKATDIDGIMELAKKLDIPVIVHSRDASNDTMEILREYKPKGVVHCFSGSAETAKEIIALGMYISFTGVITFKNAKKALRALEKVPTDRLMLETDCPYLAPEPHRGKRNDSTYIPFIAERIGEVLGRNAQDILNITCENAKKLYNI